MAASIIAHHNSSNNNNNNTCSAAIVGETFSITDATFSTAAGLNGMYPLFGDGGGGDGGLGERSESAAMTMNVCSRGAGGDLTRGAGGSEKTEETRRGGNMTERVYVPSSEHVAEIVGRQGCKIKALRSKTNTYIKTPARGEQSVFVLTGRKEDVAAAKREIISAADHFSQIRASRRHHNNSSSSSSATTTSITTPRSTARSTTTTTTTTTAMVADRPSSPGSARSQVSIGVRVPDNVVGLVVGPKGATIKRIQQETNTYIVTPGRDKDPVFEVIGSKINVETARREIESYIETRVGGSASDVNEMDSPNDQRSGGDADSVSSVFGESSERRTDVFSSTFLAQNSPYDGINHKNYYNSQNTTSFSSTIQPRQPAACSPYFPATTPSMMTSWNPSMQYDCGNASSSYADLAGAAAVGIGNALKNKETWENLINESYQNYPPMYNSNNNNNNNCDLQTTLALSKKIAEYQRGLTNSSSEIISCNKAFDFVSSSVGQFPSLLDFSLELSGSLVNDSGGDYSKISKRLTKESGSCREPLLRSWSDMVNQYEEDGVTTRSFGNSPNDQNLCHQFRSDEELSMSHIAAFSALSLRQSRAGEGLDDLATGQHRGSSCYSPSSSPTESSLSTGSTG